MKPRLVTMTTAFNITIILLLQSATGHVVGECPTNFCRRKEFTASHGFYHTGEMLATYHGVTLKMCVRRCRQYFECRSFNMKWMNEKKSVGRCELLQRITVPEFDGEIQHENYTHYFWCPSSMTYYMRAGLCFQTAIGQCWDEAVSFCRNVSAGAHLIEIESAEKQYAVQELAVSQGISYMWVGGWRPGGGKIDEFYWNSDGRSLKYTNWYKGQPVAEEPTSNCIAIKRSVDFQWDDLRCDLSNFDTICEW